MTRKPSSRMIRAAVAGLSLCGAASLFAHFAWLAPSPSTARIGETVTILLSSGHGFPAGDEPVKDIEVKMVVFDPAGTSAVLAPADKGRGLEASFTAGREGVYRVACEYVRGVISRTPEGWKPGGRSKYPNAKNVVKSYNSFLCAVRTSGAVAKTAAPLGLGFELSWTREDRGLVVLATAAGRPVEGAEISAVMGSGEMKPQGKTDASGRLAVPVPDGFRGAVLLMGSVVKDMPAGSDYDSERTSSTHFLTWE